VTPGRLEGALQVLPHGREQGPVRRRPGAAGPRRRARLKQGRSRLSALERGGGQRGIVVKWAKRWWSKRHCGQMVKEVVVKEALCSDGQRGGGQRGIVVNWSKRWWSKRHCVQMVKEVVVKEVLWSTGHRGGGQRGIVVNWSSLFVAVKEHRCLALAVW
jgi:hypothetical protein